MEQEKKGFWRNFTWQRFAWITSVYFVVITVVSILLDSAIDKQPINEYFKPYYLFKKFIGSLFTGFFFTIWTDRPQKKKA